MIRGLRPMLSLMAAVAEGCLRADPSHCANRAGDQTCADEGAAAFCSICSSQNNGCVDAEPGPDCYMPVGATAGSGETTAGEETGPEATSSTTESIECMQDTVDPACPDAFPFCIDGTCGPCTDADPGLCAEANPNAPVCHPASGACVACVDDTDCGDEAVCDDDYTCVECLRHEDCPDTACDLEARECLVTTGVFWVDPSGCPAPGDPADDPGFGSELQPYCWIGTALDNVPAFQGAVIYLNGGTVDEIEEDIFIDGVGPVTAAIIGLDTPTIVGVDTPVFVGDGAALYLQNVRLSNPGGNAAHCEGVARLWLTQVEIEDSDGGIRADDCERLTLERTVVARNDNFGVSADGSNVFIVSSAFVHNGMAGAGSSGLSANSSQLDIRYTTFVGNRGSAGQGASVACTNAAGQMRNSIVTAPAFPSFDCPSVAVSRSAVDGELDDGEDIVVLPDYNEGLFSTLSANDVAPANADTSPFRDVAVWDIGDPLRDLRGVRRLAFPGLREFAGATQPSTADVQAGGPLLPSAAHAHPTASDPDESGKAPVVRPHEP